MRIAFDPTADATGDLEDRPERCAVELVELETDDARFHSCLRTVMAHSLRPTSVKPAVKNIERGPW